MNEPLLKLIEEAGSILITSHTSPDPDALCSVLLLGLSLKENYPDKAIVMNIEPELPAVLDFLAGYDEIGDESLVVMIKKSKPELVFVVDADNFDRCTRYDSGAIRSYVSQKSTHVVVIDHHEKSGTTDGEIYINNGSPAATQDVYELCFETLGMEKPKGYVDITLMGILADTNRFMYANPKHRQTFEMVSDLLDAGGNIEKLENRLSRYSKDQIQVLGELASNVTTDDGYTYSFVSDEFKKVWLDSGKSSGELKSGCRTFVNEYIRNIEPNSWGFIVYPELTEIESIYSVSFRAIDGSTDVSVIARKLSGGGHKQAAGAKVKTKNIAEAVKAVKEAISSAAS